MKKIKEPIRENYKFEVNIGISNVIRKYLGEKGLYNYYYLMGIMVGTVDKFKTGIMQEIVNDVFWAGLSYAKLFPDDVKTNVVDEEVKQKRKKEIENFWKHEKADISYMG